MISWIVIIVLGIVEGLTEFLPVSSTGHLIVFGNILGFEGPRADCFEIFIQVGAISAVVVLYWQQFLDLWPLPIPGRPSSSSIQRWSSISKLAAGCLPAFIGGFLLHHFIKEHLFSTTVVATSLIVGGVILLVLPASLTGKLERANESDIPVLEKITISQAIKIGCFQLLALCPGVSRSASTIVGGMLFGLDKKAAAEFSFFLAVPTLTAAAGYDLLKSYKFLSADDFGIFAVGTLVSFLTAMVAIRTFIGFLKKYSISPWGWYRIAFGIFVLWYF